MGFFSVSIQYYTYIHVDIIFFLYFGLIESLALMTLTKLYIAGFSRVKSHLNVLS